MLKTYNSTVRFSKYEFYNKLLDGITLLRAFKRGMHKGFQPWISWTHLKVLISWATRLDLCMVLSTINYAIYSVSKRKRKCNILDLSSLFFFLIFFLWRFWHLPSISSFLFLVFLQQRSPPILLQPSMHNPFWISTFWASFRVDDMIITRDDLIVIQELKNFLS